MDAIKKIWIKRNGKGGIFFHEDGTVDIFFQQSPSHGIKSFTLVAHAHIKVHQRLKKTFENWLGQINTPFGFRVANNEWEFLWLVLKWAKCVGTSDQNPDRLIYRFGPIKIVGQANLIITLIDTDH